MILNNSPPAVNPAAAIDRAPLGIITSLRQKEVRP
jgi:hypothetical protein